MICHILKTCFTLLGRHVFSSVHLFKRRMRQKGAGSVMFAGARIHQEERNGSSFDDDGATVAALLAAERAEHGRTGADQEPEVVPVAAPGRVIKGEAVPGAEHV